MDPINYQLDVKSPFESVAKGFQLGSAISQQQRELQAQEVARQQQLQMQRDLAALAANKNANGNDYAAMTAKYPQLSEHFKRSFDMRNAEQQKTSLSEATQVYAALQSGNNEIAAQLLRDKAEAAKNSGDDQSAKVAEDMAKVIELHPETAKTSAALMLSSVMGPEKFAETFSKLGTEQRAAEQAPYDLKQKQVKAKYAESEALLDLEQKGWNVKKIQEDIKIAKENNRIAAMNAAIARQSNDLKRQELQLKINETVQKRDEAIREKVATVDSARTNIDNMLNTADRILQNPALKNVLGSIEGRLPSVASDEGADAIAMIETLGSQAFLAQIPNIKGMGALSNAEGEKLQSALQNLSRVQSEKQFEANLKEAQRILLKGRKNLVTRYGVPESVPDTPAATPPKGKSTDDILRELGVM